MFEKIFEKLKFAKKQNVMKDSIPNQYPSGFISPGQDLGINVYMDRDETLNSKGFAVAERFRRDPQVTACINALIGSVISKDFQLDAPTDDIEAIELKTFMEHVHGEIKGDFYDVFKEIADVGCWYGYSVSEKIYTYAKNPRYKDMLIYKEIKTKKSGAVAFVNDDYDNILSIKSLITDQEIAIEKCVIFSFDKLFSNAYGSSLYQKCYRFVDAKNILIRQMLLASRKFSQGSLLAKVKNSTDKSLMTYLKDVINAIQLGEPAIIPEQVMVETIEQSFKSGNYNPFIDILRWLDSQISLAIIGNTLSTNESQGTGTYAQSKTHMGITSIVSSLLERYLLELYTEQIMRPLLQYNFDLKNYPIELYPIAKFNQSKYEDKSQYVKNIEILTDLGYISKENLSDLRQVRDTLGFSKKTT